MNRRDFLIRGIGATIIAGTVPTFLPNLLSEPVNSFALFSEIGIVTGIPVLIVNCDFMDNEPRIITHINGDKISLGVAI